MKRHREQLELWNSNYNFKCDVDIVLDNIVYVGNDHVRMSLDAYKFLKSRLMRTTNEGLNETTRNDEKQESASSGSN